MSGCQAGRGRVGVFADGREANASGASWQRDGWGPRPRRVPAGCGQGFGLYSRDCGKPSGGIKQGQDMV